MRPNLVSFQISPYRSSWEGRRMYVHVVRTRVVPDVIDQRRSHPLRTSVGASRSISVSEVVGVAQEIHDDGPVYTHHPGMNVPGHGFGDVGPLELEADLAIVRAEADLRKTVAVEVARSKVAADGIDLGETVEVRHEFLISLAWGHPEHDTGLPKGRAGSIAKDVQLTVGVLSESVELQTQRVLSDQSELSDSIGRIEEEQPPEFGEAPREIAEDITSFELWNGIASVDETSDYRDALIVVVLRYGID